MELLCYLSGHLHNKSAQHGRPPLALTVRPRNQHSPIPTMPSLQTVEKFVSLVEAGHGVQALEQFYADNASMQENCAEPRIGKEALLKYERAAQASVTELRSTCIRPLLASGNIVVIRWVIEYTSTAGKTVRFEELAYQRWEGNLIVQEQFFYDPVQFK